MDKFEIFEQIFSAIEQGHKVPTHLMTMADEHGIRVDEIHQLISSLSTEEGEDDFDAQ